MPEAEKSWQQVMDNYRIENSQLQPTVFLSVTGGNLGLSLNYVVYNAKRDVVKDKVFTEIVDKLARSDGRLQWPTSSTKVNIQMTPERTLPQT